MRIQVRYANNRLDVFDTTSFTKSEPFDGANMLTNFEVRIDELGNTGLWLVAHRYEVSEAYAEAADENETPAARRKRGWRFLLAEATELASIESVDVDGQTTLMRISGELADMVRFKQMCELWLPAASNRSITQRAVLLFDALCRAYPELSADADAVARMCGFSAQAIDELREQTGIFGTDEDESDEEADWLSSMNEDSSEYDI